MRWKELGSKYRSGWGRIGRPGTQSCRRWANGGAGECPEKREERWWTKLHNSLWHFHGTSEQHKRKQQKDPMIMLSVVRPTGMENGLDSEIFIRDTKGTYWCKEGNCSNHKAQRSMKSFCNLARKRRGCICRRQDPFTTRKWEKGPTYKYQNSMGSGFGIPLISMAQSRLRLNFCTRMQIQPEYVFGRSSQQGWILYFTSGSCLSITLEMVY